MHWLKDRLGTPRECHRADSERDLRARALAVLAGAGATPRLIERVDQPIAYVSDGRWVVDCDCRGAAVVGPPGWDPESGDAAVAVCFGCGSVYRPQMDPNWRLVETVLLARGEDPFLRNYFCCPVQAAKRHLERPERLADLILENRAAGLPKRRGGLLPSTVEAAE